MQGAARASLPRRLALGLAVLLLALVLGLGSAWVVLKGVSGFGEAIGPWRASTLAGAPEADPWTRARVAMGGLLALRREEAIYFVAAEDSSGAVLRSSCTYRIRGVPPPGRWWSVTAYADDLFLFDTAERRYSVHAGQARLDGEGRFSFLVGNRPSDDAAPGEIWLPTPGDRGMRLMLRVYHPDRKLYEQPRKLPAPAIERVGACT